MPTTDRGGSHLLLVDDDPAVAKALAAVLRRSGYAVTIAGSATEAENCLGERFDAMVLDLRMPEMRGDAFYYLACARQPWLNCRALFVTGDITEQAEHIIEDTGCRFLLKPFRAEAMLAELRQIAPLPASVTDRAS